MEIGLRPIFQSNEKSSPSASSASHEYVSCDMASGNGSLHESSLKAPVIEVIDILSDNSSSDEVVDSLFDREPDASNNTDKNGSEDGDEWSLYEDTLDALEDQDMPPGGRISLTNSLINLAGSKRNSGYLHACGSSILWEKAAVVR